MKEGRETLDARVQPSIEVSGEERVEASSGGRGEEESPHWLEMGEDTGEGTFHGWCWNWGGRSGRGVVD